MASLISTAQKIAIASSAVLLATLASPAAAGEGCRGGAYVVRPGDTLSKIAMRCESSVEALMRANPRITSPSRIAVGWQLSVPGGRSGDLAGAQAGGKSVALKGYIVNGRRCAMIATEDGERIGVVSRTISFVSGDHVVVEGEMVDDPSCAGPRTVLVSVLADADAEPATTVAAAGPEAGNAAETAALEAETLALAETGRVAPRQ